MSDSKEEMARHEQQPRLANLPGLELVHFDSTRFVKAKKDLASGGKLVLAWGRGTPDRK